jgi:hypothetical protein
MKEEKIKDAVKKTYSEIASRENQCCCSSSCCGDGVLSQAMAAG